MDAIFEKYYSDMKQLQDRRDEYKKISDAIDIILSDDTKSLDFKLSDETKYKLLSLQVSCKEIQEKLFNDYVDIATQVSSLQDKCEHDWYNIGHDSHYDYYKCKKCNIEKRW